MRKLITLFTAALLLCCLFAMPFAAAAEEARAYVAFSANTVTVGNTVTVTASFAASSVGAVQARVLYDPDVMQFVSGANAAGGNGTVNLVGNATSSVGSLKFPLTFKAIAAGNCTFTVQGVEIISWDLAPLGTPAAGATMVVKSNATTTTTARPTTTTTTTTTTRPTTTTARPTTTTSGSGSASATTTTTTTTTTTAPDNDNTLTVGGTHYAPATPAAAQIPTGYTADTLQFGAMTLDAYVSENGAITLLYLSAEGADAAWFIADTVADALYPYYPLEHGDVTYHLLPAEAPADLAADVLPSDDYQYPIFTFREEARADFVVFKAITAEGSVGWYCWDTVEDTLQRYVPLTATSTLPTTTTTAAPSSTSATTAANTAPLATPPLFPWMVAGGLLLVCIALAILAVVFYRRALPPRFNTTPRH